MRVSSQQLARVLFDALEKTPDQEARVLDRFFAFCEEKRLVVFYPYVVAHLEHLMRRARHASTLHVSCAREQSPETMERIRSYVGASSDVPVVVEIHEDLIGGFIAQYQHTVYDGSMLGLLARARRELVN